MSAREVAWRVEDRLRQEAWARGRAGRAVRGATRKRDGQVRGGPARVPALSSGPREAPSLPVSVDLSAVPEGPRDALLVAATSLLDGRMDLFGNTRTDMIDPQWSLDPVSGQTYPDDRLAFRIDYRSATDPRDVKQVWELSRHQHLVLLACAWRLSGDDRFASLAAAQLQSWWAANPVLMGVNWASGIELGVRLISWVWVRRLLDGWTGAGALFEDNPGALEQIYWHQRYLAAFPSRGSSANNHAIAEAAGRFVASCAFPWFPESARWRAGSAAALGVELARNTFRCGLNREQAFEYHGFVAELVLAAAVEAKISEVPLAGETWQILCRMLDATASILDCAGNPPRYGDSDDGRGFVLDAPACHRWRSLLAAGAAVFGDLPWWPAREPDIRSVVVAGAVAATVEVAGRPEHRRSFFADAGLTILRNAPDSSEELWCRCDSGPHGYLSIAAHAHADALSIELRHDGIEVFADPGTFCYYGTSDWRRYFRSTLAHNTVELNGEDQAPQGGPFLWTGHPRTGLLEIDVWSSETQRWSADQRGYERLVPSARHRRTVTLDLVGRTLRIEDSLESDGPHDVRLVFHLGPDVEATLSIGAAKLHWTSPRAGTVTAALSLPDLLQWRTYRGSTDPMLGWYSSGFGRKQPATALVGSGRLATAELLTELRLL